MQLSNNAGNANRNIIFTTETVKPTVYILCTKTYLYTPLTHVNVPKSIDNSASIADKDL